MIIIYGSGVPTRPAGQPLIYHMVQCQGPPRLERSVFLSTFGKKIQRIFGEDHFYYYFFLVFSYIWQNISAAKYWKFRATRNGNTALKKIIRPTPSLQF